MDQLNNKSLPCFSRPRDFVAHLGRHCLPHCCGPQKSRRATYLAVAFLLACTPLLAQEKSPEPVRLSNTDNSAPA